MSSYRQKAVRLFELLQDGLTLLDVGATGGIQDRWSPYKRHLNYIGIEADDRAGDYIGDESEYKSKLGINSFAWSSATTINFNLCRKPQVSSAFAPNPKLLNNYFNPERFEVLRTVELETVRLDSCLAGQNIDFVKLDVHGAELDVIEGMGSSFESCLGLEIEIAFSEIYTDQALFGKIDEFLRSKGFFFSDFVNLYRWERDGFNTYGRCVFGDGLWLRSFQDTSEDFVLKYIAVCAAYGKLDEAEFALKSTEYKSRKITQATTLIRQLKASQANTRFYIKVVRKLMEPLAPEYKMHLLY